MALTDWLTVTRGTAPLILSIPHAGTTIPEAFAPGFVSLDRACIDTDWFLPKLYDFAAGFGATIITTAISRSVIDMNRDPSGASLYPGQITTGLCPSETFDGRPLYHPGAEPDEAAVARRLELFHAPYHTALAAERDRLLADHARIVILDAHSIASVLPRLFHGTLPLVNIGTADGAACDPALPKIIEDLCGRQEISHVTDGRFKGGWITRHYGRAGARVHAIQIELAWRGYMREPPSGGDVPPAYDEDRAQQLRTILIPAVTGLRDWAADGR